MKEYRSKSVTLVMFPRKQGVCSSAGNHREPGWLGENLGGTSVKPSVRILLRFLPRTLVLLPDKFHFSNETAVGTPRYREIGGSRNRSK